MKEISEEFEGFDNLVEILNNVTIYEISIDMCKKKVINDVNEILKESV